MKRSISFGAAVFIVSGVLFFVSGTVAAQVDVFSIRNYTAIDGLPQSQVKGMVEDKSGYLWIGTEGGGLARFDGREFKVYSTLDGLLSNQVIGLRFDSKDNLWILHPRGVTRFNGLHFKTFQTPRAHPTTKSLRRMYMLRDTVFILSGTGLTTKIHQDSIYYWEKDLHPDVKVWAVHATGDGRALLLRSDSTLLIRSGTTSRIVPVDKSFGKVSRFFDYKGNVVAQTTTGDFTIDMKKFEIRETPMPVKRIVLRYDERADAFWTTAGNMVYKEKGNDARETGAADKETTTAGKENGTADEETGAADKGNGGDKEKDVFGKKNGTARETQKGEPDAKMPDPVLVDVEVIQVLDDSEGNTWFASNGAGLFKYFNQDFVRLHTGDLRGVMAIYRDREGATWAGTMTKGLYKIQNGKVTPYIDKRNSFRNAITSIKESPWGELWVGTSAGLGRYNRDKDSFTWYTIDDGLPAWWITAIEFDGKGMWIGTGNGLCYFDGRRFKTFTGNASTPIGHVTSMRYLGKYNTLFIGGELTVDALKDGKLTTLPIPEIQNSATLSIQSWQDSVLMIGTAGAGVVMYNPTTHRRKMLTTREGLASDFVYLVTADEKQNIWIGTEKGINRLRLDRNHDITENLHFDNDNGLQGVETNQNSYFISPDAKYFGLVDGLYQYNDLDKRDMRSFDIHLTDVKVLYGEHSARDYSDSTFGFYQIPFEPVFPPDRNHLTFQFNRVDKRYSKSVRYQYFLENFDKTWSKPSTMDQVTYSNLPPGRYTFRVMTTNNRGSWSDTRIAYAFTVRSPFYQTTAFFVGAFIFVAGMVTLILYLRVQQKVNRIVMMERLRQREQELLRKEIARDFHDEMGNQLTRIINYVSLMRLKETEIVNEHAAGDGKEGAMYGHADHGNAKNGHTGCGNGNNGDAGHAKLNNGQDLYTKVEDAAKYLYSGTRDFIWSIDPVNDELSKLFIHIRDFGETLFGEKNMNFRAFNEIREKIRLPYGFSRQANLIFKEAMTNAFKYSGANNISFSLRRDQGDGFEFCFEDDGIGFSDDELKKSNGLQNIRDRANRIDAVLRIQSVKQQGTKIILNFTLNKTIKYGIAV